MAVKPVRFFLQTRPTIYDADGRSVVSITDVGYTYLLRFKEAGAQVRALSIGGPQAFPAVGRQGNWRTENRWVAVADCFTMPFEAVDFLNVVCDTLGNSFVIDDPYGQPATVLSTFEARYTPGVLNVAITTSWPNLPTPEQWMDLARYRWVFVPEERDFFEIRDHLGADSIAWKELHPEVLPPTVQEIQRRFGGL